MGLREQLQVKDSELARCQGKIAALDVQFLEIQRLNRVDIAKQDEIYTEQLQKVTEMNYQKDRDLNNIQEQFEKLSEEHSLLKSVLENKVNIFNKSEEHWNAELERFEKLSNLSTVRLSKLQSEYKASLAKSSETISSLHKEKTEFLVKLEFSEVEIEKLKSQLSAIQGYEDTSRNRSTRTSVYVPTSSSDPEDATYGADFVRRLSVTDSSRQPSISNVIAESIQPLFRGSSVLLNHEMSEEYKKRAYEDYLGIRKTYAISIEFSRSLQGLQQCTDDSKYENLASAITELSRVVESTVKKNNDLKKCLEGFSGELIETQRESSARVLGLEVVNSALCAVHNENRRAFDEESESLTVLESVVDILKRQLHDIQSQLYSVLASDEYKTNVIRSLENDAVIHATYIKNLTIDLEKLLHDRTALENDNDALHEKLTIALEDIADLESSFDRLYLQASAVQKERNDIVDKFLSLRSD